MQFVVDVRNAIYRMDLENMIFSANTRQERGIDLVDAQNAGETAGSEVRPDPGGSVNCSGSVRGENTPGLSYFFQTTGGDECKRVNPTTLCCRRATRYCC